MKPITLVYGEPHPCPLLKGEGIQEEGITKREREIKENIMNRKKRIKDLPLSTRPQEELLAKGAAALSEAELLAILLGTGNRKQNAVELAKTILKKNPLKSLVSQVETLKKIPGVGKTKMARILAGLELGERVYGEQSLGKVSITSAQDVVGQVGDIVNKKQEQLVVLYLNARQELIQKEVVAMGNINVLGIELREVLAPALLVPCASIVVVHNHPSGDPSPSDADITFTKQLQEAGKVFGIVLFDHVIVAHSSYFSFAEEK